MPAFHGRHRVRIGLDGRRPLRRTAAIPSASSTRPQPSGKMRQLAHRPEERRHGAVSPFGLTSRPLPGVGRPGRLRSRFGGAGSRRPPRAQVRRLCRGPRPLALVHAASLEIQTGHGQRRVPGGRRPARSPAGPAHPPVRTQVRGAGRRVARIVADGDRHSAAVRPCDEHRRGRPVDNRPEELVLYGMAECMAGEVAGEVKVCLWNAAVPALPVIARDENANSTDAGLLPGNDPPRCRAAQPWRRAPTRSPRPPSPTPPLEAAPARPSTASRGPGIFRSAPRNAVSRRTARISGAPKRNRCVCAVRSSPAS